MPEYRITFIHDSLGDNLDWMRRAMCIRDRELFSRFVIDNENPDYVIATDKCYVDFKCCEKLTQYFRHRKDSIFIFFTYECVEPDMNIFDYAFTWNPDFVCGDRVTHNVPYILHNAPYVLDNEKVPLSNDLTRDDTRRILNSNTGFCNFIYSHPSEPRDSFFRLLSQYKHVDSSGSHLNNTGTPSTRWAGDWYTLSIKMKEGYKFSIAMENSSYKGYTSEKIITSLQAHTVPIYWGDPAVADLINPKAFINCNDYSSFDEVIERVKEIDSNDELWLDMVTQPWQTEEQHDKVVRMLDDYDAFIRNIFTQDIKKARRRGIGIWPDNCRKCFTGTVGVMPPLYLRATRKARASIGKLIPARIKPAVKKFLHMD